MIVTRFAPSPTGALHLGHALSALHGHDLARSGGGRFLLRIDDLDQTRSRPEHEAGIHRDLAWLGLIPDPPLRRQSDCLSDYAAALQRLRDQELLYPCTCSRAEILAEIAAAGGAPHGPEGPVYPGTCHPSRSSGTRGSADTPALRLDLAEALRRSPGLTWTETGPLDPGQRPVASGLAALGDVVLGRRDAVGSYHLAVVLDDAATGVTHVTRGADLLFATPLQRLLIHLLDLPVPVWSHHPLILDGAGRRLAKRDQARSLESLRWQGWEGPALAEALRQAAAGFLAERYAALQQPPEVPAESSKIAQGFPFLATATL